MRAIWDHISKQFSLTNEKVFTLADRLFKCPGMDAVNHGQPVQPSVLVAPFLPCHRRTKNLTFSSTQVVVLGMEGSYYAPLFKGNCTKCRMWYNVDSVAYMSKDKQKQLIEMYLLETIMSVGFLKINEQYYVTIPFADLWPSVGIFLHVYHMLLLQQYISKIPANDDYQHMRFTHFRPSWAPKTTHVWSNSLFLGPYLPKTGDSIHDIRPAMREYVTFMTDYFSKKWCHRCDRCHQYYNRKEISGSVMDGKVMGHLLCSVPGCVLPILGVNTLFCSSHAQLKNECIISGCKQKKTDTVLSTCGLSSHNATVQEIIGKQWNKDFKATRKSKKTRTSSIDVHWILPPATGIPYSICTLKLVFLDKTKCTVHIPGLKNKTLTEVYKWIKDTNQDLTALEDLCFSGIVDLDGNQSDNNAKRIAALAKYIYGSMSSKQRCQVPTSVAEVVAKAKGHTSNQDKFISQVKEVGICFSYLTQDREPPMTKTLAAATLSKESPTFGNTVEIFGAYVGVFFADLEFQRLFPKTYTSYFDKEDCIFSCSDVGKHMSKFNARLVPRHIKYIVGVLKILFDLS
ncbi:hypothetical protein BDR26DRAFT_971350 [Obelidium mucronatum]|nr:hypothetical protein BDR26DRAFT_971350 [Obelidium mucronatum]